MKKTGESIKENLKLVDVVFELIDARAPRSSKNPMLVDLLEGRPKILLVNKLDLADDKYNQRWLQTFKDQGEMVVGIDAQSGHGLKNLYQMIDHILEDKRKKDQAKGIVSDQVRAMIVGIPNVGKSTLINTLVGRKSTNVGNKPGITRSNQWVKVKDKNLYLLDTPGVLWPKFESQDLALNLAFIGSIKDEILPIDEIGLELIARISETYPDQLEDRYKIKIQNTALETMEEIGRKRGALISKGQIDYTRVANIVLDEFRKATIVRISLEHP